MNLNFFELYLLGLGGIIFSTGIILIIIKSINIKKQQKDNAYILKCTPYLNYIRSNIDRIPVLDEPYFELDPDGQNVLKEKLINLISIMKGENQEKLIKLINDIGFIEDDVKNLNNKSKWVVLGAVERLGKLKIANIMPILEKLLEKHTAKVGFYIIARSMIMCSNQNIAEILKKLIKHKRSYNLIADILKNEVKIDKEKLFNKIINQKDEDLIIIGLLTIDNTIKNEFHPNLFHLVDTPNKELKILLIKSLRKFDHELVDQFIDHLIKNTSDEAKYELIKVIGDMRLNKYLDYLNKNLSSSDWWTKYYSTQALTNLGERGIAYLYEFINRSKNNSDKKMIISIINENIENYNKYLLSSNTGKHALIADKLFKNAYN